MSKFTEGYRLFKKCLLDSKGQALIAYTCFNSIKKEFNLYGKSILELGAGNRAGLTYLFDNSNEVIGIDKYLGRYDEGLWKATKSTIRGLLFVPLYKHFLKKFTNECIHRRKVLQMDATNLNFTNERFDFIYSRSFLEHIRSIDKVASEIYRCLKTGGTTYHTIGLYTKLDGAHSLDWERYPPWHHLIGHVPRNVYINKYSLSVYKNAYKKVFGNTKVKIRISISEEAKNLLTPVRYAKLNYYSKEELLAGSVELIAVK